MASDASAPPQRFVLTDKDITSIVRDVSAARQLEASRPVEVVRLKHDEFVAKLLGDRDERAKEDADLTRESAFLLGFDFVPEPGKRAGIAKFDDVLEEQVVGFYDRSIDKVFLPKSHLRSADDLLQLRAVLAHETQHALQAQHFPEPEKPQSSDEAVARLSLIEGDAQAAMGAFLGAEAGAPVGRSLRRLVEVTKRVPVDTLSRGEQRNQIDRALALTRRRLEFPYVEGMLFVSDLYRAGGFSLVNKAFETPPVSTAQILHPEKYLRGELPRPFSDPKPPAGYTVATTGTLGELDTAVLLSRCLSEEVASSAASGWAGDRFGVFVGPTRQLALGWVSAWDTEEAAVEMQEALSKSQDCWHDNALGLAADDYAIGSEVAAVRQGKLVAFVRGLPRDKTAATQKALLSLAGREVSPKAVSDQKIPPRVALPEPTPGQLRGDVYENTWLDLVGRIPPGMLAEAGGDVELSIHRPDILVHGGLSVSLRITSDEQNEKTIREVQDAFVEATGKLRLRAQALGGGAVSTQLGAGIERSWRAEGTAVELRLVLIPICAGTGSIVFMQLYGDARARSVLDGWMGSFRWTHGRNLKACDYLDPK